MQHRRVGLDMICRFQSLVVVQYHIAGTCSKEAVIGPNWDIVLHEYLLLTREEQILRI